MNGIELNDSVSSVMNNNKAKVCLLADRNEYGMELIECRLSKAVTDQVGGTIHISAQHLLEWLLHTSATEGEELTMFINY